MAYIPTEPERMPTPFTVSGQKNTIPVSQTSSILASLEQGFPSKVLYDDTSPEGLDVNGICHWISQFCVYWQSGGLSVWNDRLNYTVPSIVIGSDENRYFCLQTNGVDSVLKDPVDAGSSTYWFKLPNTSPLTPGVMELFLERPSELPYGWYFMNGDTYALTSAQGQALQALSTNYKIDWGIDVTGVNPNEVINIPNFFASNGTGATFTPANGTDLSVGQIQEDMGRNATGAFTNYNIGTIVDSLGITARVSPSPYTYQNAQAGNTFQRIDTNIHSGYPAANRGTRFKVYGRGMTPAMFLGV